MATKFTTKQIDGNWCVVNGPMTVEKFGSKGRTEARNRAKELNAPKPVDEKIEQAGFVKDGEVEIVFDATLAAMDETELYNKSREEHRAQVAAKKAGKPIPEAPHLDELQRRHNGGQLKHQNGNGKHKGSSGSGRAVRLDDQTLVAELTRLVKDDGVRTCGAAIKRLREIGKGSNGKRVAKAWAAMLDGGVKLPEAPKADKPKAPAKSTTKATATKAAAGKREVTPRLKGAAAKVANQQRAAKGSKAAADKSPSDIGKEANASKRLGNRRQARKAS